MEDFSFTCVDLNAAMLRAAQSAAAKAGIEPWFTFRELDITKLKAVEKYDVIIANQCLHHLVALEQIFDTILARMTRGGLFLTSDVIGRNGHQLWPEALTEVQEFWEMLPRRYKHDRTLGRTSERLVNYDHANLGFEGIRAQDVLPLLIERFEFEVFAPYACIVMPFVERRFGWNFDDEKDADKEFIDRVAMRDETLLASGRVKPTQMLARMTNVSAHELIATPNVAPRDCIRWPD